MIQHQKGGTRDDDNRLAPGAFGLHRTAADTFEIGERSLAVWAWAEPAGRQWNLLGHSPAITVVPWLLLQPVLTVRPLAGGVNTRRVGTGSRCDEVRFVSYGAPVPAVIRQAE